MKIGKFFVIVFFCMAIFGCVSIEYPSMHDKSFPASDQCIVLGEINCEGSIVSVLGLIFSGGIRYTNLLEEARKKYGQVDDVINISVDKTWRGVIWLVSIQDIVLRGIAIVYTDTLPVANRTEEPPPPAEAAAE